MANLMNVTLMMVILAFFIVLVSISVPADSKKKKALGSLVGSLGILPGGLSPTESDSKDHSIVPGPILSTEKTSFKIAMEIERAIILEKAAAKSSLFISKRSMQLTIESSVLFYPSGDRLTPSGKRIIAGLASLLSSIIDEILIEGHTSDLKIISAKFSSLDDLSIARAGRLARKLLEINPALKGKVGVSGYGGMRPLYPNDTKRHREQNDRIRIIYKFPA